MGCTSSAPKNLMPSSPTVNATVQTELEAATSEEKTYVHQNMSVSKADLKMELPSCDSFVENVEIAAVASGIEAAVVASQIDPPITFADHSKDALCSGDNTKENTTFDEAEDDYISQAYSNYLRNPDDQDVRCQPIDIDNVVSKDKSEVTAQENNEAEDKLTKLEEVVERVVELYVADAVAASPREEAIREAQLDREFDLEDTNFSDEMSTVGNEDKEGPENAPESPSRSTSSRATRWEALADIAAELPPSLAVDPLTGQIYTSK